MEEGLRERKKRETRQRIADIAMGLFMAKGFDNVTVAEVARAADVSVNTVFNYFRTKEDLFADRQDVVVDLPRKVLRERRPGEGVVAAFRRDFLDAMAGRDWRYGLNQGGDAVSKVIAGSPALVARFREIQEQREEALAAALADELDAAPEDLTPRLAAAQILTATRLLSAYATERLAAGEDWVSVEPDLRAQADTAFGLLRDGLADYGRRPLGAGLGDDGDGEAEGDE
ncbi:TetR/AcrR family transcriptional regulator [Actinomadura sp. ATCC 31491]|uniref:TetR/AcrR family transcriptional regulator n=1 Tax=Actinomadura luzonensis TaxID=2805427 RepID=A0ABT0FVP7_9ACTN|nr:TetR/AcrR family transcriptional regulator [Actinomadura luzonensis]MCK2216001.1 TetR/AcrR family transcriptional regulator [Actinomadura luzonensis]